MHRPVEPTPNFPVLETEILDAWNAGAIQKQALAHREGAPEWVFYEGPPTANTLPPLHGVWPRAYKDIFTRYRTMKGSYVPRKAGWDCHGLPVEIEIERKLGFTNKQQIVEYGVERFNDLCRKSVTEYVEAFVDFSERLGFWLDYDDPYHTMDDDYIESVWWSLAELHRRGLLFEGDKVTPWCPRCETPLADHEVAQGYQDVVDPGVTLALPLEGSLTIDAASLEGAALAVWTTTPWTLISNLAVAVHPGVTYALAANDARRLVLAEALVRPVLGEGATVEATFPGSALVGLRYRPPFAYAGEILAQSEATREAADANGWRVLPAEFVNVTEGTGVVHMAGAFGADDLEAVTAAGIPIVNPVDTRGRFDERIADFSGVFVKDADPRIVELLGEAGVLLRSEPYTHAYPHCWRCDTPLLYYARKSWYIRTTDFRERFLEVNAGVNWIPEHIRDGRYGNWLANNVDWSLSRYRFWGTPLPIWRCESEHDTAIESRAQLGELAGRDLSSLDLHRPHVDEVVFACSQCGTEARRVPDLIDVWYDSGAMPFAQWGYPRRNKELFARRFPADFIAEAVDQTRGWFYSLMAEGVMLFDDTAYRNVICHGHLVDETGRKMSKSLGNVIDPDDVFSRFGADALRFYIFAGGQPGDTRRIGDTVLSQVVRGPFLTLWNVYRLYVLYANVDGFDPNTWEPIAPAYRPLLDRWILSELNSLIFEVDEYLEVFDCTTAGRRIGEFIDDLSNWYVRRSRRRFWRSASDDEARLDKSAAYWTLWTCLVDLTKLLAPFTPFLADALYRNLVCEVNPSAPASVHLTDFPEGDPTTVDVRLAAGMAAARELASLGHQARSEARVKVRQPLGRAVLLVPVDLQDAVQEVAELLADELNVSELAYAEEVGALVRVTLRPNYRTAGPALGPRVRQLGQALEALSDEATEAIVSALEQGDEVEVDTEEGPLRVSIELVDVRREPEEGTAFAYEAPFGVSLDLEITPELRREGLAREFVHQVQTLRRDAGLDITDRIALTVQGSDEIAEAVREFREYVTSELLATDLQFAEPADETARTIAVDGSDVRIAIVKA